MPLDAIQLLTIRWFGSNSSRRSVKSKPILQTAWRLGSRMPWLKQPRTPAT